MNKDHTLRAVFEEDLVVLFEDGFESNSFSAWDGTTSTSSETTSVSSSLPHHGTYSARFTSDGDGGYEHAYSTLDIPASSQLYARGYFRVSQSGIAQNDDRFTFIRLRSGGNDGLAYAGWRMTGGSIRWCLVIRDGSGWIVDYSSSSPSLNNWYSVELRWVQGSSSGLGELYVVGVRGCDASGSTTGSFGRAELVEGGISVDNLGTQPFLPWAVFQEAICVLIRSGGRARRGGSCGTPVHRRPDTTRALSPPTSSGALVMASAALEKW